MIDYKDFSRDLDGLWPEILQMYGIEVPQIKQRNSKNHPCPLCGGNDRAHWREEGGRLALYCRNCAADKMKSPEDVIMEYSGIGFVELVKSLSDYINHKPIEQIIKAKKKVNRRPYRVPVDHVEEPELAQSIVDKAHPFSMGKINLMRSGHSSIFAPIYTAYGDLVNLKYLGQNEYFLAGGFSYNGYTPVKVCDSDKWHAVDSILTAKRVLDNHDINIMICWSDLVMKYICMFNHGDKDITPILTDKTDDYLAYEKKHFYFDGQQLLEREIKE